MPSKFELKDIYKNSLIYGLNEIDISFKEIKETYTTWKLKKHDDYPEIGEFDSGIPRFNKNPFKKNYYTSLLTLEGKKLADIPSFNEYLNIIKTDNFYRNYYDLDEKAKISEDSEELFLTIYSHIHLSSFIERYIHLNGETFTFNQAIFDNLFEKWYNSIFINPIGIEIYVPIIFLNFNEDIIQLEENIFLVKTPENIQLARNTQTSFIDSSNSIVAGSSTHSIVFKNWTITNEKYDLRRRSLYDINSYTAVIEIVNDFLCALRIATGIETGTSQIISIPIGWEDVPKADLSNIFFCSVRNYPNHFDDFGWLRNPPKIDSNSLIQVKTIFEKIRTNQKNNVKLAVNRINLAFLRNKEEDTILDTTIALETLITHDSTSEITYRLSSRVAALCEIEPFEGHTQLEVFNLCKKIYNFRSDVVHGNSKKLTKSRVIKLKNDKEIPTVLLSISLLRHVLKILLLYPEYFDLEKIDNLKFKS